jgi:hypothetical protein
MKRILSIILFLLILNHEGFCQDKISKEANAEEVNTIVDSLNFVVEVSYSGDEYTAGYKAEFKTEGGKTYCYYTKNDPKKTKVYKKIINNDFIKELKERINYRIKNNPDNCNTQTIVKISNLASFLEFSFSDCQDFIFDDDFFKLK